MPPKTPRRPALPRSQTPSSSSSSSLSASVTQPPPPPTPQFTRKTKKVDDEEDDDDDGADTQVDAQTIDSKEPLWARTWSDKQLDRACRAVGQPALSGESRATKIAWCDPAAQLRQRSVVRSQKTGEYRDRCLAKLDLAPNLRSNTTGPRRSSKESDEGDDDDERQVRRNTTRLTLCERDLALEDAEKEAKAVCRAYRDTAATVRTRKPIRFAFP